MRPDLHIDGFAYRKITVGGTDATDEILGMIYGLKRDDINLIMLSGCVIAWYNIIEPHVIHDTILIPVICVSYEESEGLREDIERHFPGDIGRINRYEALGERTQVHLPTGYSLFARGWGVTEKELIRACILLTHHGKIPEPLRVARIAARSMTEYIRHETGAAR